MRRSFLQLTAAAAIVLGIALSGSNLANAQSVMKVCGDQWKAGKAAGTTNGETWPQFLAQCRAQQNSGAATPPTAAPATAAVKTVSQCDAEYAANKAAIRASGQTKKDFVAACRAGNETIPQGTAAAPPAAPAPAPSPASAPAPAPTQASGVPAEPLYSSLPKPIASGEFASDQQASAHCPADTVVWVNTKSRVYHFAGTHNYAHTKEGAYMCEADAKAAGDRAAMNERHP